MPHVFVSGAGATTDMFSYIRKFLPHSTGVGPADGRMSFPGNGVLQAGQEIPGQGLGVTRRCVSSSPGFGKVQHIAFRTSSHSAHRSRQRRKFGGAILNDADTQRKES